jgi:hypothetical protein
VEKKTVSVKAVLADIKSGVHDTELMRRHELTPGQLERLFTKLVDAGYLSAEDLEARKPKTTQACPFCSAEIPANSARCPRCEQWLQARPEGPEETGAGPDRAIPPPVPPLPEVGTSAWEEKYCAWEDFQTLGWWKAFTETVKESLLNPTEFYSKLPALGGFKEPLIYGVISIGTVSIVNQIWSMLLGKGSGGFGGVLISLLIAIIVAPITAVLIMFIGSGLTHLCLSLVGGASESYEATFRVVAYSQGTALLGIVPVLGALVGAIWNICIVVVGLKEIHGASTGQAVAAILLPGVVCCGGLGLILFLAVAKGMFHV